MSITPFLCRNGVFKHFLSSGNNNLCSTMFLRSQRVFGQKIEKNVQKKWFFMVFENFGEGIFGGLSVRNFYRGKNVGQVSFCPTKKIFVKKFQKLTEKSAQVGPPPKKAFFGGGADLCEVRYPKCYLTCSLKTAIKLKL